VPHGSAAAGDDPQRPEARACTKPFPGRESSAARGAAVGQRSRYFAAAIARAKSLYSSQSRPQMRSRAARCSRALALSPIMR